MDGKEGKAEWAEAVGATALVCVLGSLALIAAGGWAWFAKFLDTSAPAWVQAVGSVGAIIATGWSVRRAHRLQQEQRSRDIEDEYTRLLEVAFFLVARVRQVAGKIQGYELPEPSGDSNRRAMQAELSALLDGFRRFEVHRLQQFDYVQSVLAGEGCARHLLSIIEADFRGHPAMRDNDLAYRADGITQSLEVHARLLDSAITARTGRAMDVTKI